MNWDDLRIFLAVSEAGNLSAAARALRISQPTVSRRIAALEEQLSARLFDRLPHGLMPTEQGAALLQHAREMARAAEAADRQTAAFAETEEAEVRISVNEQTALFLIDHLPDLRARLPGVQMELAVSHLLANLSRREADLLIRNCMPDYGALVAKKLGVMAFAVYGAREYVEHFQSATPEALFAQADWIGWDEEHQYMSGQDWLVERLGQAGGPRREVLRVNDGMTLLLAVRRGVGLGVLPCCAGDADPSLVRLGGPLRDAAASQYLLVHPDLRKVPAVRRAIDALAWLFEREAVALAGSASMPMAAQ